MAIGEPTLVLALNGRSRLEGFMHSAVARLGGDVDREKRGLHITVQHTMTVCVQRRKSCRIYVRLFL